MKIKLKKLDDFQVKISSYSTILSKVFRAFSCFKRDIMYHKTLQNNQKNLVLFNTSSSSSSFELERICSVYINTFEQQKSDRALFSDQNKKLIVFYKYLIIVVLNVRLKLLQKKKWIQSA
jgi:hypothetical protein